MPGAGRGYIFTRIVLPAAFPTSFACLRLGASHVFAALVAAEYHGATEGLGSRRVAVRNQQPLRTSARRADTDGRRAVPHSTTRTPTRRRGEVATPNHNQNARIPDGRASG
ncbi:ABC transporter permease subunit [Rhodococcus sp. YH1]|uniref:ABC transporter permease subunit n=1 Tax=Rhodococcus sp. YH1 TaxID=89066 RepID=UPI001386E343